MISSPKTSKPAAAANNALMIIGALVFSQVGMSVGDSPDLILRATTEGALAAGDFREIRDRRFGMRRFYRASVDAQGRVVEGYWEDGQPRPIDSDVRRWIEDPPNVPPAR